MTTLKPAERSAIDAAIAAHNEPRAPNGGRGLILSIPAARYKTLVDAKGARTKFGAYYYGKVETPAPDRGFDYNQVAKRVGRRETIQLLDGSTVMARTWNPRTDTYKFSKAGKEYYKHHTDRWLVQFPALVYLRRKNGSYYIREEYLPSSAVEVGEISLSATMTYAQQKEEVLRRANAFIAQAEEVDGSKVLMAGYETWT